MCVEVWGVCLHLIQTGQTLGAVCRKRDDFLVYWRVDLKTKLLKLAMPTFKFIGE